MHQSISSAVSLPAPPPKMRDLRLDLFRGLANWLIFLGHVPDSILSWFTTRNYGFSDSADLFVFISGYTAALVFSRQMESHGFIVGATRLWRRVWQLYAAHLLLFLIYLTGVHYLAHSFDDPHLMDQFNVSYLMNLPVETLTQGVILRFKPLNLDVLPLYIVLMGAFPPILWIMLKRRNVALVGSVLLYFLARHYDLNLTAYPVGVWYFNPFTWQFLFVAGAWLALGPIASSGSLLRSKMILSFCLAFVAFAFIVTLSSDIPMLGKLVPDAIGSYFIPNDKTNLALYRIAHLASLIYIVASFIPQDWKGLRSPLVRPLIVCGQQSLPVFCVGLLLSFVAHFTIDLTSAGVVGQLLVGLAGISLMTLVAYYQAWSKRVDRKLSLR